MKIRVVGALFATCIVVQAAPASSQNAVQQQQRQGNAVLTLRQALQQAANASPRIEVADRNIGMADGRRQQANKLPNPTIGFEIDNFSPSNSTNVGGAETTLMLSQLIELGGKRDARVSAALGDYDAMRWEREAARLELLSETTIAFVEALSVQRRIGILDRQATALEKLVPLMQRRVEAGASSPFEVSRTQAAVGMARLERERARLSLAVARRDLAALMGRDTPDFTSVSGDFGRIVRPAALDTLIKAIDDNPQLMRWTAIRAQRDGELLVARLKPIPDVTASLGWRYYSDNGESAIRLGVSMPFPVMDRNRGGIREAQENAQKVQAERAVNRLNLLVVVAKAHDTANSQLQQLDLIRKSILPAARQTMKIIEEGYGQGRFTLLEILDAYRTVADAELMEHEALAGFHTAVATIEGLTSSPINLVRAR
ncbi:TolC family protein [Reyranella sp.]|jgi:cobalt-zinc-cadmium efflux system outer membrane protein|uniref:TolC family protein n=1 Tax=Reyranella sp. TaxID=1929291 RepID=UPI003BAC92D0